MADGHKQFTGTHWMMFEEKQPSLQCAEDCPGCEGKGRSHSKKEEPEETPERGHKKETHHGKSHRR